MKFKLIVNVSCNSETSFTCRDNIFKQIKDVIGNFPPEQGHISIRHTQNSHVIWIFLYDQDGKHEGESHETQKTVYRNLKTIKKFKGVIPSEKSLKNALKG